MFTVAERQIFGPYFNGAEEVLADPLRVYRRLHYMLDGDPNKFLRDSRSKDGETAFRAKEKLIAAALFAFELTPFDKKTGQGVLDADALAVLRAFVEWINTKKEKGPTLPTYSPAIPAMQGAALPPAPTMPLLSPYGLIPGDCDCKKRGQ